MDLAYPFLCPASFEEPPRRRAARLETKRTHLPTQKHVCGALPYYPLSAPLPPMPALSQMSLLLFISLRCLFSLSLSLSLLLSLLLCFCDLFVSASRPIFNFFFLFPPAYPSPSSSLKKESSASRIVLSRAHRIRRCIGLL